MHLFEMGATAAPELGVLIFSEQENILRIAVFLIVSFCPVTIRIVRGAMFIAPRLAMDVGTLRRKLIFVVIIYFRISPLGILAIWNLKDSKEQD